MKECVACGGDGNDPNTSWRCPVCGGSGKATASPDLRALVEREIQQQDAYASSSEPSAGLTTPDNHRHAAAVMRSILRDEVIALLDEALAGPLYVNYTGGGCTLVRKALALLRDQGVADEELGMQFLNQRLRIAELEALLRAPETPQHEWVGPSMHESTCRKCKIPHAEFRAGVADHCLFRAPETQDGPSRDFLLAENARLKAALKARAETQERGWQSIDSAPKDGTWIIVTGEVWDGQRPEIANWSYLSDCWQSMDDELINVSHWMPLPSPPAQAEDSQ